MQQVNRAPRGSVLSGGQDDLAHGQRSEATQGEGTGGETRANDIPSPSRFASRSGPLPRPKWERGQSDRPLESLLSRPTLIVAAALALAAALAWLWLFRQAAPAGGMDMAAMHVSPWSAAYLLSAFVMW